VAQLPRQRVEYFRRHSDSGLRLYNPGDHIKSRYTVRSLRAEIVPRLRRVQAHAETRQPEPALQDRRVQSRRHRETPWSLDLPVLVLWDLVAGGIRVDEMGEWRE